MFGNNDYRDYLMHKAADGSEWRNHKYIDKVRTSRGWRYIYPEHENPYKQSNHSISKAITKGGTKVYSAKQKFLNAGPVATPERFRGGSVSAKQSSRSISKAITKGGTKVYSAKQKFLNAYGPVATPERFRGGSVSAKQSSRSISKAITKGGTKVYSAKQKFLNAYGPVATPERFRGGSVSVLGAKARNKLKRQHAKNRFTLLSQPVSKATTKAKRRIDSAKLNFMNYAHPQNNKTPITKARQKASRFKRRNFETFARNARHIRQAT